MSTTQWVNLAFRTHFRQEDHVMSHARTPVTQDEQVIEGADMHVVNHVQGAVLLDALHRMAPCQVMVDSRYIVHSLVGYSLRTMATFRVVSDTV